MCIRGTWPHVCRENMPTHMRRPILHICRENMLTRVGETCLHVCRETTPTHMCRPTLHVYRGNMPTHICIERTWPHVCRDHYASSLEKYCSDPWLIFNWIGLLSLMSICKSSLYPLKSDPYQIEDTQTLCPALWGIPLLSHQWPVIHNNL